jgi:hypothetical protein
MHWIQHFFALKKYVTSYKKKWMTRVASSLFRNDKVPIQSPANEN